MSRGFNLSFRLYLEGVLTPFKSANIICTPNGVEASISLYANRYVYDLKPKTAVQIFYKDWISVGTPGWRIMFDGFYSAIIKEDNATEGRMVGITCRDFRMDMRRSPAYLSFTGDEPLGTLHMYSMNGLYNESFVKGAKYGSHRTVGNREYDNQLCTLAELMRYIAGTAYKSGTNGSGSSTKTPKKNTAAKTTTQANIPPDSVVKSSSGIDFPKFSIPASSTTSVASAAILKTPAGPGSQEQAMALFSGSDKSVLDTVDQNTLKKATNTNESNKSTMADAFQNDEEGYAKCGLFLDAFIRGLWSEAVGGTAVGVFTNKRIRMDKRFLVPSNRAGYNFWNRQSAGLEVGGYMMSDSRFSSLEAAIMRCSALFSVRVYSCNTPSFIPVSKELSAHNPYSTDPYGANIFSDKVTKEKNVLSYIIDDSVRANLVDNANNNFGAKYILNESMLLPPMEFTAPPNCNIFLPPFCNRTSWQFDMDSDITRGYYSVVDSMSGYDSTQGLNRLGVQVPNTLFDMSAEQSSLYKGASKKDKDGRFKPPITIEERFKGINVTYGTVNQDLAMNEVVAERRANPAFKNSSKVKAIAKKVDEVQNQTSFHWDTDKNRWTGNFQFQSYVDKLKTNTPTTPKATPAAVAPVKTTPVNIPGLTSSIPISQGFPTRAVENYNGETEVNEQMAKKNTDSDVLNYVVLQKEKPNPVTNDKKSGEDTTTNALRRHALLKYLNEKYAGRVVTIDMMFNPYPMCGFPGMFIDDEEAAGSQSAKTIVGMVQQVKHLITITSGGAEASTTVLMNNARFIDEPTDMDQDGNALYMAPTNKTAAEIDIDAILYKTKNYRVPEPLSETYRITNSRAYDMGKVQYSGTRYAKDFLSISEKASKGGRSNIYYLDNEYTPQHIPLFYKKVFQHTEQSFMVGSYQSDNQGPSQPGKTAGQSAKYFIYDTMHEAVVELRANRKELLYDYDAAMHFISRNVCSADCFYQGILGLSIAEFDGDKQATVYTNKKEGFDDTAIYDEYFGVSDYDYTHDEDIMYLRSDAPMLGLRDPNKKLSMPGLMRGPGEFSSILETTPATAFIKERKDAVLIYINEANKVGQGMRFTVPEEK